MQERRFIDLNEGIEQQNNLLLKLKRKIKRLMKSS